MKVKLSEIKERLSLFCNDLNLTSEQRVEFSVLLEQVGKFKTGVLMIEEKTFRDYIIELLVFKFLRVKRNEIEEVENFVINSVKTPAIAPAPYLFGCPSMGKKSSS